MSKKNKPMRIGSHEYVSERYKEVMVQEATLSYRNKLRAYLSFSLKELKELNHQLYDIVSKKFPDMPEEYTLDDLRITSLMNNMITLGSMKAVELSYKIDGTMSDTEMPIDHNAIEEEIGGIE